MPAKNDRKEALAAAERLVKAPKLTAPASAVAAAAPVAVQNAAGVEDAFGYPVAYKFAFVGTGQAGNRIADAFYQQGYRRVCLFNTTDADFKGLCHDGVQTLSLGMGGAAKDMKIASERLAGRSEDVWDLYDKAWRGDADYVFVCVGLGGGTGSGTCVQLVELARKYLKAKGKIERVGAIVALPSVAEGQRIAANAIESFAALMRAGVSPLILVDNARINELYKPSITRLHGVANTTVSQLLHMFNYYAAVHSDLINFDRAELGRLLDGGLIVMGAADIGTAISSPAVIASKIRDELNNTVLATVDIRTGLEAGCLFVGGHKLLDTLPLDYFEAGWGQLDRALGEAREIKARSQPTVVHRGLYKSDEADAGLQCYTMVSGLSLPYARLNELATKAGISERSEPAMAKFFGL